MEKDNKYAARFKSRLTEDQKKVIDDLIINEKWSDARIAEHLNIKKDAVSYYRKQHLKLTKDQGGNIKVDEETDDKSINKLSTTDADRIKNWEMKFRTTPRYNRIHKFLTAVDLEYFSYQWAIYHVQLEDMSASEEDTLENMLFLKIRVNENQKSFKQTQEHEDALKKQLGGNGQEMELELENDADRMLFEMIQSNNRVKIELNKEYKELTAQLDKMQESLNVTRKQREERKQIGGDTFIQLVKMFNDRDIRKGIGMYNERMKHATEKKTADLKNNFKFEDGTIEPLLLDGADYKKDKTDGTEQN